MLKITQRGYGALSSNSLTIVGSLASIISLLIVVHQMVNQENPETWQWLLAGISVTVFVATAAYSIRVRLDNNALISSFDSFHSINHLYRDALSENFLGISKIFDPAELLLNEKCTLEAVCQRISKIFVALIRRPCLVTVKLLSEYEGKFYAETHVRSESKLKRDYGAPRRFEVKTGLNTALDEAIDRKPHTLSYFHSPDLEAEPEYANQRPNWREYYKSAIVVPIRYADPRKAGQQDAANDLGFLCVDTKSKHRLNDGFHVQILCAFADQMYNFIRLMRGNYCVPHQKGEQR